MVLFFALCMYLLGAMLYLTIITLIFYRFTFLTLTVDQLTPPYWINMGAVAITTLAGASLLLQADRWPFLVMLRPFLTGSRCSSGPPPPGGSRCCSSSACGGTSSAAFR